MLMKSRLFASVAAPVLTLPLLIQPAAALPAGIGSVPHSAPGVVQVQQPIIPEEEGQGRERRRERQNADEQGGERPQRRQRSEEQQGGGERQQRRQQQEGGQSEGQERPQRRQQQDAGQSQEQERPQRRQRTEEQQGGGERQQRRQQQESGQSEGQERPQRRQQQQDAGQSEEQQRPRRQQQGSDQSQGQERPQRGQQRETDQSQGQERPRRQQDGEQQQRRDNDQQRPRRDSDSQSAPERTPSDRTGNNRPEREPTSEAPRPRDGEMPRSGNQPSQQRDRDTGRDDQGSSGRRDAPERSSGGERNQPRAVQNNGEEPRLPVENGAAVLDSAKERPDRPRRDGDRPRRDATRQTDERPAAPPRSDADAQASDRVTREQRDRWRDQRRELAEERGQRLDRRPDFERPRGWDVRGPARGGDRDRDNGRVIISIDNQAYVRHNDSRRFYRDGREPEYERLGDGRFREVVVRDDGTRIVTIRNRYGEVVQRSRVVRGGDEYVLYYAPELLEDRRDYVWRDPGDDLPPMRLTVPIDDYIVDTSSEPDRDYYAFLEQPPVERVERVYSLDEVRYSARIRDKVPRIDLDTITFATGSAEVPMSQASSLRRVADAINKVLQKDPSETFLIEGHTDAVGSDDSNLVLSDERAESVAVVLSDAFGIPPENLTTQGYGERYLKVNTDGPNQENRRVTIRRITPLVKPVASNQ